MASNQFTTLFFLHREAGEASGAASGAAAAGSDESSLWTVKYAPHSFDKIVGQAGPKSPANKLKVGEEGLVSTRLLIVCCASC